MSGSRFVCRLKDSVILCGLFGFSGRLRSHLLRGFMECLLRAFGSLPFTEQLPVCQGLTVQFLTSVCDHPVLSHYPFKTLLPSGDCDLYTFHSDHRDPTISSFNGPIHESSRKSLLSKMSSVWLVTYQLYYYIFIGNLSWLTK